MSASARTTSRSDRTPARLPTSSRTTSAPMRLRASSCAASDKLASQLMAMTSRPFTPRICLTNICLAPLCRIRPAGASAAALRRPWRHGPKPRHFPTWSNGAPRAGLSQEETHKEIFGGSHLLLRPHLFALAKESARPLLRLTRLPEVDALQPVLG